MPATRNVAGAVKILGLPDETCFTDFKDFLNTLQKYIVLELPESISNVIVSNLEPSSSQRDNVWFRFDNAGNFIGIFLFTDGAWTQVFPTEPPVIPEPDSSGWFATNEDWTTNTAGSSTVVGIVNVPAGALTRYQAGDKIRISQDGLIKHFNVTAVANTTLSIYAGTNHFLSVNAITLPYVSRADVPLGFPSSFNYVPAAPFVDGNTGNTVSGYTFNNAIFFMKGQIVTFLIDLSFTVAGGGVSSWVRLTSPLYPAVYGTPVVGETVLSSGLALGCHGQLALFGSEPAAEIRPEAGNTYAGGGATHNATIIGTFSI